GGPRTFDLQFSGMHLYSVAVRVQTANCGGPNTMMTTEQRQVLEVLGKILDIAPEYRVGQLVTNLPLLVGKDDYGATAVIEDEELLEATLMHLQQMLSRMEPAG